MKRAITVTLASARRVLSPQLAVFLLAVVCSLGFSFIIYPAIASPQNAVLDPDRYGALGFGLWHHGTLSYYPDPQPTLDRGPIYPAVIAVILWLSGGVWPQSLQAAQAVFFGLTSVLVFYIGEKVWGRRTAMAAAALTTVHPFLLWYTSRVWIETLATLLFTALAASLVFFHERPGIRRGMLVGAVAGVATLCKATFLPFLLFVPMVLLWRPVTPRTRSGVLALVITAVLTVLPWTVRNYRISGEVIPVHLLAGFNFQVGDVYAEHYGESPLGFDPLWDLAVERISTILATEMPVGISERWEMELASDSILLSRSIASYRDNPAFLLKKVLLNAWMFWSLSESPRKSIVVALLQLPLLLLTIASAYLMWRRRQFTRVRTLHTGMVSLYFLAHLPIYAIGRLSVVLVPLMLVYAVQVVMPGSRRRTPAPLAASEHDPTGGLAIPTSR